MCSDSTVVRCSELGPKRIEQGLKEMGKSLKMKNKKTKSQKQKRFISAKDYELIEEELGILYSNKNNQQKIQEFASQCEKIKMLRLKNQEMKNEIEVKRKELQTVRCQPNVLLYIDRLSGKVK